jgi:putative peptidoglycan lipid II flippase
MGYSHSVTVHVVAIFVLLSGIAQSYVLFSDLKRNGFRISVRLNFWTEKVKDIMKNMTPGIIGAGVWQLNLLIDTTISSYLPTGTITCVSLADRLNQFPLGTLGIALSTALLPALSKHIGLQKYDDASRELERGLLFAFFPTFFATTVLIALDVPSVAVAFQRGLFDEDRVIVTAMIVDGFAIGLPAYVLTKVFSAVYFASGDTKSPVIFGVCSMLLNVVFLLLLVPFGKYLGLAMCTSLSAISNAGMLIYFCDKNVKIRLTPNFVASVSAQFCASIGTYFFLIFLRNAFWTPELGSLSIKWPIYAAFIAAAVLMYFFTSVIIMKLLKQKNWRLWQKKSWE